MIIGLLTLELDIEHAQSLKDKRAVLNRVKERVRSRFNVSISEIEAHDVWNYACLGVAVVSNEQRFANQVLSKVIEHVEAVRDCELGEVSTEYIHQ
ncbi:MAG TPA: DUF503 domain-containing protein [Lentisphaeria bacterium]|nr:DUF503 domain-containing protein [Lentisphaeria bacterium]